MRSHAYWSWYFCPRCDWAGYYPRVRYCGACINDRDDCPVEMYLAPNQAAAAASYLLGGHEAVRALARKIRERT